ncbi:NADH-quinone oxidoreductase subunit M [Gottfriedia luciferensis]|uniref:NADH-quinone oxidoreductase subunit M n=1 Tax=Gottfriedia luciferensis TaxID=178774 RepID=A0ABX2ZQE1_9BACI|nr:NADH-quinone oxidoreductase subunit M [Gottfriedia luciferensis]ODG91958.1 NADH-quinone oxidoreductase subunit M [Gottfriedia luciferensis]
MMSHFLLWVVFSPLLGLLLVSFAPKNSYKLWALLTSVLSFAVTILAYIAGHNHSSLKDWNISYDWFSFGKFFAGSTRLFQVKFELGVDGLSLVMILLTGIISLIAVIAGYSINKGSKGFYQLLFILQVGMFGVFAAQNLVLFFLFFELTLVPMFFLIGKWGRFDSERAGYQFLIYNGLGSAFLLFVIAVLFARTGTTNYEVLANIIPMGQQTISPISEHLKMVLLICLLIAFAIKLPLFPFHRWMVNVHTQANPAVVIIHAGILLKIGTYGLIRFALGIFPEQFEKMSTALAIIGVINLLYGAYIALIQKELRSVLAYSSFSHMGIVIIGLAAMNSAGIQGAILQSVSHGLIAALLFLIVGMLENRGDTTSFDRISGLSKSTPRLAGLLLFGGMASLGLPGLSGFVGEWLSFVGLFQSHKAIATVGTLGIILTAAYILRAILQLSFGKSSEFISSFTDLSKREAIASVILVFAIVLLGVYPAFVNDMIVSSVDFIIQGIRGV